MTPMRFVSTIASISSSAWSANSSNSITPALLIMHTVGPNASSPLAIAARTDSRLRTSTLSHMDRGRSSATIMSTRRDSRSSGWPAAGATRRIRSTGQRSSTSDATCGQHHGGTAKKMCENSEVRP
jgi:hypothetical protein